MPDKIVNILNAIIVVKGEEFAEGFVACANLLTPEKKHREEINQPG